MIKVNKIIVYLRMCVYMYIHVFSSTLIRLVCVLRVHMYDTAAEL